MGKTYRTIGTRLRLSQTGFKESTPIKSKKKSHEPQNKWPKRLQFYKDTFNEHDYEAGSGISHRTKHYDNQRLNHAVRQHEKSQIRKEIRNQLIEDER